MPGYFDDLNIAPSATPSKKSHFGDLLGDDPYTGSTGGGFLRSVVDGATANFADEAIGTISPSAKETWRRDTDAFAEDSPWISGAGNAIGAIGSTAALALTPGGQPAAATRAAALGTKALSGIKSLFGANAAAKAIPGVDAAVNLTGAASHIPGLQAGAQLVAGGNARRGGIAAAQYGATSRAGDSDGGVQDRVNAAIDPGMIALDYGLGTGLTGAANMIMPGVGTAVDNTRNIIARSKGESGAEGGVLDVARRMKNDGASPQGIRDVVFPTYKKGGTTQDEVASIMERYGQLVEGGADDAAARKQIVSELQQAGGAKARIQRRVNTVVKDYLDINRVPSQINELTALSTGKAGQLIDNSFVAKMNMAADSPSASKIADFMDERHPQIAGRIDDFLSKHLGDGDVERMIDEIDGTASAANDMYPEVLERFDADPRAGQALSRALNQARLENATRYANRTDDIAQAVTGQMQKFSNPATQITQRGAPTLSGEGATNVTKFNDLGDLGTTHLDGFIGQRASLSKAIGDSKTPLGKGTPLTAELMELKRAIDDRVRGIADDPAHPKEVQEIFRDWASANDLRAHPERLRGDFRSGASINLNARGGMGEEKMVRAIKAMEKLSPERQGMFLRGVMSQLRAKLDTKGDFDNVAKMFSNERMRAMMARMMGKDAAEEFVQLVRRANLATRSQRANKRSPTGMIRDEKERSMLFSRIRGLIESLSSPAQMAKAVGEKASDMIFRKENEAGLRILGANTEQPHKLIEALRQLDNASKYTEPTFATPFIRQSGPFISIPTTEAIDRANRD